MVDLPSSPLAAVDTEFEKMALETGGFTFGLPGTSVREKLLQVTAHDICRASFGLPFKMHVLAMSMHGIPYADMLALIRFVAPYSGYPSAAGALGRVAEIAGELGLDTTAEPSRVTDSSTGGSAGVSWPVADSWMAGFVASRTGRAWSEERLSPRERAFVALTAHVTQRALGESFRRHVELALKVAGADDVRDAVRFTAEMGVFETCAALEELEKILATS
ncbi:dehydrogenase [Nonomuraea sp. FMUSA5-5]|uniref:Dehydrogenase n=1 Tax=Nonomuraea composti TaxID=2720023 RepID=A0ABX1BE43_9ACTN|nr:dehydrogenase [Nonomuraea sp. FMUSA5-5]NJP94820.1 dehydrogenase [Nonomuraea sp. FMUSA5-5]